MRLRALLIVVFVLFCVATVHGDLYQWSAADGGNDHWYGVVTASELTAAEIDAAMFRMGPDYAVVGTTGLGWHEASVIARLRGGILTTIQSQAENDFVFSLVNDPQYWVEGRGPWFGGIQDVYSPAYDEPDKAWIWITDYFAWQYEPMVYTNWYNLEPNNQGGWENAIHFCTEGSSVLPSPYWNDLSSTVPCNSFVVEYDVNPVPVPGAALLGMLGLGYAGMRLTKRR